MFFLDKGEYVEYDLNMFKKTEAAAIKKVLARGVGANTRNLILEKALDLFRSRGFEPTTMRDIAKAAKVATGAAYYYFPSKEAIVSAYYEQVQTKHGKIVREQVALKEGLRERLGVVAHSKLDILRDDRKFLGALFRYTGEPSHPLSVFGEGTRDQRTQSMQMFREASGGAELSAELQQVLPWVMWLMHLAMILFFIYDESEGQRKTHKLVDGVLDLVVGVVGLTSSALVRPFVKPFQEKIMTMLRETGLSEEM